MIPRGLQGIEALMAGPYASPYGPSPMGLSMAAAPYPDMGMETLGLSLEGDMIGGGDTAFFNALAAMTGGGMDGLTDKMGIGIAGPPRMPMSFAPFRGGQGPFYQVQEPFALLGSDLYPPPPPMEDYLNTYSPQQKFGMMQDLLNGKLPVPDPLFLFRPVSDLVSPDMMPDLPMDMPLLDLFPPAGPAPLESMWSPPGFSSRSQGLPPFMHDNRFPGNAFFAPGGNFPGRGSAPFFSDLSAFPGNAFFAAGNGGLDSANIGMGPNLVEGFGPAPYLSNPSGFAGMGLPFTKGFPGGGPFAAGKGFPGQGPGGMGFPFVIG